MSVARPFPQPAAAQRFRVLVGLILLAVCMGPAAVEAQDVGRVLPRSTPEAQGVSSAGLVAFLEAADAAHRDAGSGVELHSLMVVRHGQVVAEGWWAPYAPAIPHMLFSLSKSFTSTAVGLAVAEGRLRLDDRVTSFFPDDLPETVSDHLAAMRVRDLLTMSTGQVDIPQILDDRPNWVASFLAYPVTRPPGTHFTYNTMATFTLSAIVQRVTGQTVRDYLVPRLFAPLGIDAPVWDENPQGISLGGVGLNLRTEDLARFGLLYLNEGAWDGRQLVPRDWVQAATAAQIASSSSASRHEPARNDWAQGYGYQFWRTTHDAYRGDGAFGQYVVVLPDQDAVLVATGGSGDMQAVLDLFWAYLLPAFHDGPLPEDDAARRALEARLGALTLLPVREDAASPLAARVSGVPYAVADNALGIRRIRLEAADDACGVTVWTETGEHRIACALDGWANGQDAGPLSGGGRVLGCPVRAANAAVTGAWTAPDTFTLTVRLVETPFTDVVTFRFSDDAVRVAFGRRLGAASLGQDRRPELLGRRP